jgi:hypothetical protein
MTALEYSDSVLVSIDPDRLYAMVSDVTRTGEWSPVCRECWWDEGDGPRVGASFTGRNETPERTWETRSQVVAAEPGTEFAWEVNGGFARWGFTLEPADGGTRLTEHWHFLPRGIVRDTARRPTGRSHSRSEARSGASRRRWPRSRRRPNP